MFYGTYNGFLQKMPVRLSSEIGVPHPAPDCHQSLLGSLLPAGNLEVLEHSCNMYDTIIIWAQYIFKGIKAALRLWNIPCTYICVRALVYSHDLNITVMENI